MPDWGIEGFMQPMTTTLLGRACRTFMDLAYPDGPESIPLPKRAYYDLPGDQDVAALVPPAAPASIVQALTAETNKEIKGWAFRLGSTRFPHLKLKVQLIDHDSRSVWVFMVDTHDNRGPAPDHPDAPAWAELQQANRQLKEQIEDALEAAGLTTFNSLLRRDLLG